MARGIYKRGNVYWIRYMGLDRRIHRESSGSTKFKDAESLLVDRKQEANAGQDNSKDSHPPFQKYRFLELASEYLKWAERQRSFRSKAGFIKQLVLSFKDHYLTDFNTRLLEQYQSSRMEKGNKAATINRHIATIKHMFTKANEWDMVDDEVLKRVRRVKLFEENNRRLRYLSKEECRALINACDDHLRPIVITALNTGMRKGEILSLKWNNLDLTHGFILLNETKNGERREIPINETLKKTMEGLVRQSEIEHVFYDRRTGKAFEDVKKSFYSACRRAGIKDFKFHDLRHTFASQLVMAGVDLTTVKELLGHKSLTMTLRYAHLSSGHKRQALRTIDEILMCPKLYLT